jgi:hypothetical protein
MKKMCDSGLYHEEVYDARCIFVGKVCEKCREENLGGFRSDIFTDPNYPVDEPVDEEE